MPRSSESSKGFLYDSLAPAHGMLCFLSILPAVVQYWANQGNVGWVGHQVYSRLSNSIYSSYLVQFRTVLVCVVLFNYNVSATIFEILSRLGNTFV